VLQAKLRSAAAVRRSDVVSARRALGDYMSVVEMMSAMARKTMETGLAGHLPAALANEEASGASLKRAVEDWVSRATREITVEHSPSKIAQSHPEFILGLAGPAPAQKAGAVNADAKEEKRAKKDLSLAVMSMRHALTLTQQHRTAVLAELESLRAVLDAGTAQGVATLAGAAHAALQAQVEAQHFAIAELEAELAAHRSDAASTCTVAPSTAVPTDVNGVPLSRYVLEGLIPQQQQQQQQHIQQKHQKQQPQMGAPSMGGAHMSQQLQQHMLHGLSGERERFFFVLFFSFAGLLI
jgi:hypothetical protein